MNKRELAARLAKQSHTSRAKAADDVDSLVYGILKEMKETAKQPEPPAPVQAPKPPAVSKAPKKDKV